LPTKQPSIEELSLITSDPCDVAKEDWEYEMDLTQFTSLNEFSWCGGMSRREFGVLRNMLHTHSSSLKFLKLDLVDWWDAQYNWCDNDYDWEAWIKDHNFFTEKVLGVCPEETHLVLSALKSLSLSSVGLRVYKSRCCACPQYKSASLSNLTRLPRRRNTSQGDCGLRHSNKSKYS
jgi:hypothetical protein